MATHTSEATTLLYPVECTGVLGRAISGKTTLIKVVREAAVFTGIRVLCIDNSEDVHEWHLNPVNRSPYLDMCERHKEYKKRGELIPDDEVNILVTYFIRMTQIKAERHFGTDHRIGTVMISGWPRTQGQIDFMKRNFVSSRLGIIDISAEESNQLRLKRIKEMRELGKEPRPDDLDESVFWNRQNVFDEVTVPLLTEQFKTAPAHTIKIDFKRSLTTKAEHLVIRGVGCCPRTRCSLRNQIKPRRPGPTPTKAQLLIQRIEAGPTISLSQASHTT